MSIRGDAWACFGDDWPHVGESGFDATDGWIRLGEIPDDESAFWKACGIQLNGGASSAWKRRVDFYLHVFADSSALPHLSSSEQKKAEAFWLGFVPFAGVSRRFVSKVKVARAEFVRRAPEMHPGRIPVEHRTLGFRLRLGEQGTYFDDAR